MAKVSTLDLFLIFQLEEKQQFLNPLTPKFISWKQPFPGIEHVAYFPMSHMTLRPLHGGQTSQGKCARVAPTFDPINDIHESHGGVAGGYQNWRYAQSS